MTDNNSNSSSSSSNNQQGNSSTTAQSPIQTPKPPYIPSPIRMTIIENGLTMDKLETKTIKQPKQ